MKCEKCSAEIENSEYPLCMHCGFMKTTIQANTKEADEMFSKSPLFVKDISVVDENGFIWSPASLYLEHIGAIYSIYNTDDKLHPFNWHVAKIVVIPLLERVKYPIIGKPNEYYETKLDVENAKVFVWNEFREALHLFESYLPHE